MQQASEREEALISQRSGSDSASSGTRPVGVAEVVTRGHRVRQTGDSPRAGGLGTAIILGGSHATTALPLANYFPKLSFPVAGQPLLAHLASELAAAGVDEIVALTSPEAARSVPLRATTAHTLPDSVKLRLIEDEGIYGTAGSVGRVADVIAGDCLVLGAHAFLAGLDLRHLFRTHRESGAAVTAVVGERPIWYPPRVEVVQEPSSGRVIALPRLERRSLDGPVLGLSGVFILSQRVLERVRDAGYMDMKEQLLPSLLEAGELIQGVRDDTGVAPFTSLDNYFEVNLRALDGPRMAQLARERGWTPLSPGVWAGRNVEIGRGTRISGPVVLDDNVRIGRGTRVIGPTVVGAHSVIGERAVVRESILWDHTQVGDDAKLTRGVVTTGSTIDPGRGFTDVVLIDHQSRDRGFKCMTTGRREEAHLHPVAVDVSLIQGEFERMSGRTGRIAKRVMDVVVAFLVLLFASPLMLLIAIAVKLDSPGDVLFRQERCGIGGRAFGMLKFRTMVANADQLQRQLKAQNESDGPMFKIARDPRITRVGRFLRRTSLDELPQLMNVLAGQMSLVGPRPLAEGEMQFSPSWRDIRLRVKPGMTGPWQVFGRESAAFHEWIKHDVDYVRHWSFCGDVRLLVLTAFALRRGV
ncbi:MAG: sugar transferase [Planctomycetota bacterium]